MEANKLYTIDALKGLQQMSDESVDCIITSPPYWAMRNYNVKGQIGMEKTPREYVQRLVVIFMEAKRVLKKDGTLWINIADTYGGGSGGWTGKNKLTKGQIPPVKPSSARVLTKSLIGIPFLFANELISNGWLLRNTIIWQKPNTVPESAKDRFTNDFEYLFFFSKSKDYFFNQQFEPIKESTMLRIQYGNKSTKGATAQYKGYDNTNFMRYGDRVKKGIITGRNKRAVWEIPVVSNRSAHFAVFPEKLIETPVIAGCKDGGIILDPFMGSGTTGVVAKRNNRKYIGFDLNPQYIKIATKRIAESSYSLNGTANIRMKIIDIKEKLKKSKI